MGVGGGMEVTHCYSSLVALRFRAIGVRCARLIRRLPHEAGHLLGALPQRLLVVRIEVVQSREGSFAI